MNNPNNQEQSANSLDLGPRCLHRTPTGRRCRSAATSGTAGLCRRHAVGYQERDAAVFAAALTADPKTFLSAVGVHRSLAELHALLAKDLISPRRAAVLAYIASLLLRTLPAIQEESAGAAPQNRPVKIIFDIPHPPHEDVQQPS